MSQLALMHPSILQVKEKKKKRKKIFKIKEKKKKKKGNNDLANLPSHDTSRARTARNSGRRRTMFSLSEASFP